LDPLAPCRDGAELAGHQGRCRHELFVPADLESVAKDPHAPGVNVVPVGVPAAGRPLLVPACECHPDQRPAGDLLDQMGVGRLGVGVEVAEPLPSPAVGVGMEDHDAQTAFAGFPCDTQDVLARDGGVAVDLVLAVERKARLAD